MITAVLSKAQAFSEACHLAESHLDACKDIARRTQLEPEASQKRLNRFHDVEGKPTCDYCGLPLTAEHLEVERQRLQVEMVSCSKAESNAMLELGNAREDHERAKAEVSRVEAAEAFKDRYHIRIEGETSVAERIQMA